MELTNVNITRAIAHDVVRASQLESHPPVLSEDLIVLDAKGKALFARRLVDTVSSGSHCVDVSPVDISKGSPFDKAAFMLDASDKIFLRLSKELALALSTAQTAGPIKSGSAIFLQGTCIADGDATRFLAVIKADSDQGFSKRIRDGRVTLEYVSDMVLGESQRLIKIAFFMEEAAPESKPKESDEPRTSDDFSVKVFDHMMQNRGDRDAAAYFYKTFLRCEFANDSSRQTKKFWEETRSFLNELEVDKLDRHEYMGGLVTYMRGNAAVISSRDFAREVLPPELQDQYIQNCKKAGVSEAITKDTDLIRSKLRNRSMRFSSNVTITGKPEAIRDSVRILGEENGWTNVQIKGSIEELP